MRKRINKVILAAMVVVIAMVMFTGCEWIFDYPEYTPPAPVYKDEAPYTYTDTDGIFKFKAGTAYGLTEKGKQQTILQLPSYYDEDDSISIVGRLGYENDAYERNLRYYDFTSEKLEKLYINSFMVNIDNMILLTCPNLKLLIINNFVEIKYEDVQNKFNGGDLFKDLKICVPEKIYKQYKELSPEFNFVTPNVIYMKPEFMGLTDEWLLYEDKDFDNPYPDDSKPLEAFIDYAEPGQKLIEPMEKELGYILMHDAEKNGKPHNYRLEGWYTEKEFINKWDFDSDVMPKDGKLILYAKYVEE